MSCTRKGASLSSSARDPRPRLVRRPPDRDERRVLPARGRSTAVVITADVSALQSARERALDELRGRSTIESRFELGRRFTRDADLLSAPIETAIEDVGAAGGQATMGMLGVMGLVLD